MLREALRTGGKALGAIGMVLIDERPLDALLFGLEERPCELALDSSPKRRARSAILRNAETLASGREAQPRALVVLPEGAVPKTAFKAFDTDRCAELHKLEWQEKTDPGISPDMDATTIELLFQDAGHNAVVSKSRHAVAVDRAGIGSAGGFIWTH